MGISRMPKKYVQALVWLNCNDEPYELISGQTVFSVAASLARDLWNKSDKQFLADLNEVKDALTARTI